MRLGAAAMALQDDALGDVSDDVAGEAVIVGTLAEGHLRRNGPGEILLRDRAQAGFDVTPQRLTGVDLVTGDPDFHLLLRYASGAGLRPRPGTPSTTAPAVSRSGSRPDCSSLRRRRRGGPAPLRSARAA